MADREATTLEASGGAAVSQKKTPSDFLKHALGKPVVVKLNGGVDYRGVLACLDGFMNIAMEQTEEYHDGQLKASYGDCFIRGNNGMLDISFSYEV
jgi:U6 snRNA-associated Sm-like protein LSm6